MEDGQLPQLDCPLCGKDSCLLCQAVPFHIGSTCDEHKSAESKASKARIRGRRKPNGSVEQQRSRSRSRSRGRVGDQDALAKWMQITGTRQCPGCGMGVSKEDLDRQTSQRVECHKMICRNCDTRFCFGCLQVLTGTSSCGCTGNTHGFIDPKTGGFVQHLNPLM
ncbi:unnamed protein product, partial [Polarella glacialis]